MLSNETMERIAKALERIADAMEKKQAPPPAKAPPKPQPRAALPSQDMLGKSVQLLIKEYIDAFRRRYGPKSRPDVGGRVQGLMRTLLKDHPLPRLVGLVQAFCQMDDPWFVKKAHDFPTLYENLGKVQTALLNGTGRAEDARYWAKVFGDDDAKRNVPEAGRQIEGELRRASVQGGEGLPLLESARAHD